MDQQRVEEIILEYAAKKGMTGILQEILERRGMESFQVLFLAPLRLFLAVVLVIIEKDDVVVFRRVINILKMVNNKVNTGPGKQPPLSRFTEIVIELKRRIVLEKMKRKETAGDALALIDKYFPDSKLDSIVTHKDQKNRLSSIRFREVRQQLLEVVHRNRFIHHVVPATEKKDLVKQVKYYIREVNDDLPPTKIEQLSLPSGSSHYELSNSFDTGLPGSNRIYKRLVLLCMDGLPSEKDLQHLLRDIWDDECPREKKRRRNRERQDVEEEGLDKIVGCFGDDLEERKRDVAERMKIHEQEALLYQSGDQQSDDLTLNAAIEEMYKKGRQEADTLYLKIMQEVMESDDEFEKDQTDCSKYRKETWNVSTDNIRDHNQSRRQSPDVNRDQSRRQSSDVSRHHNQSIRQSLDVSRGHNQSVRQSPDVSRDHNQSMSQSSDVNRDHNQLMRQSLDVNRDHDQLMRQSPDVNGNHNQSMRKSPDVSRDQSTCRRQSPDVSRDQSRRQSTDVCRDQSRRQSPDIGRVHNQSRRQSPDVNRDQSRRQSPDISRDHNQFGRQSLDVSRDHNQSLRQSPDVNRDRCRRQPSDVSRDLNQSRRQSPDVSRDHNQSLRQSPDVNRDRCRRQSSDVSRDLNQSNRQSPDVSRDHNQSMRQSPDVNRDLDRNKVFGEDNDELMDTEADGSDFVLTQDVDITYEQRQTSSPLTECSSPPRVFPVSKCSVFLKDLKKKHNETQDVDITYEQRQTSSPLTECSSPPRVFPVSKCSVFLKDLKKKHNETQDVDITYEQRQTSSPLTECSSPPRVFPVSKCSVFLKDLKKKHNETQDVDITYEQRQTSSPLTECSSPPRVFPVSKCSVFLKDLKKKHNETQDVDITYEQRQTTSPLTECSSPPRVFPVSKCSVFLKDLKKQHNEIQNKQSSYNCRRSLPVPSTHSLKRLLYVPRGSSDLEKAEKRVEEAQKKGVALGRKQRSSSHTFGIDKRNVQLPGGSPVLKKSKSNHMRKSSSSSSGLTKRALHLSKSSHCMKSKPRQKHWSRRRRHLIISSNGGSPLVSRRKIPSREQEAILEVRPTSSPSPFQGNDAAEREISFPRFMAVLGLIPKKHTEAPNKEGVSELKQRSEPLKENNSAQRMVHLPQCSVVLGKFKGTVEEGTVDKQDPAPSTGADSDYEIVDQSTPLLFEDNEMPYEQAVAELKRRSKPLSRRNLVQREVCLPDCSVHLRKYKEPTVTHSRRLVIRSTGGPSTFKRKQFVRRSIHIPGCGRVRLRQSLPAIGIYM